MAKNGAYNGEIQNAVNEIFDKITPYVYHEARWGFCDSLVYLPEKIISEKIQQDKESLEKTPLKVCRFFRQELCNLKTQKWDWNVKEGHSYMDIHTAEKQGKKIKKLYTWKHRETGQSIDSNKFDIINIPKIKKQCLCDGKVCEHYLKTLESRKQMKRTMDKGIHLIEIKTDRDNVKRFGSQLPHYCLMGDFVWLVLETKKLPDWVPSFVGIMRYENHTLLIEREPMKLDRFPYLNLSVIKNADKNIVDFPTCSTMFKFLQDWFINSIFQWKTSGENVVDMSYLTKLIKLKKDVDAEKVKVNNKTIEEYLS